MKLSPPFLTALLFASLFMARAVGELMASPPVRDPASITTNEFVDGRVLSPGRMDFTQRIPQVLPKSAIFRQSGWCLWDPCIVKGKDGLYHLLYSRWPVSPPSGADGEQEQADAGGQKAV